MEDIVQDRKARLARDVKRDETLDCVVEYVWSDAAPVFTGTLETYCKENKDNLIDKMNKGHLIGIQNVLHTIKKHSYAFCSL